LDKYQVFIKNIAPEVTKKLQIMKDKGWQIVCIRLPISDSVQKIENGYIDEKTFSRICQQVTVPYFDYSKANCVTHDGAHLSMEEARYFSYLLTKDLISTKFLSSNPDNMAEKNSRLNSWEFTDKVRKGGKIPKMVENDNPKGYARASSVDSIRSQPWKAMNYTNNDSLDCWISNAPPTLLAPQWLEYEFEQPTVITEYALVMRNDPKASPPRNWVLKASDDGDNWIILDIQQNQFTSSKPNTAKRYALVNDRAFKIYRLEITKKNGASLSVDIGEFILW
jgi:hypothetical protein